MPTSSAPDKTPLKRTKAFSAIYRRGKWARGSSLSMGILQNSESQTRVGLRTRRGLKGAVERNRLKRQLRAILYTQRFPLRPGMDVVIVIHPKALSLSPTRMKDELRTLCKHIGALA
ncbi:MAG: ribonuclease P protein component [Candidatus Omnitrophica bacterium]|nr:ribonuclease P protein component [Candidatus Omnitrophota bacterium]